jgi:hypothetical protein
MRPFHKIALLILVFLSLLSCKNEKDHNCFGVRIPDFKNPRVDSLVRVKDAAMCVVVERIKKGEEPTFEEGLDYSNNGMRHMTIFEWLDADGDQKEIDKYGEFNVKMGDVMSKFNKERKKKTEEN